MLRKVTRREREDSFRWPLFSAKRPDHVGCPSRPTFDGNFHPRNSSPGYRYLRVTKRRKGQTTKFPGLEFQPWIPALGCISRAVWSKETAAGDSRCLCYTRFRLDDSNIISRPGIPALDDFRQDNDKIVLISSVGTLSGAGIPVLCVTWIRM